MVAGFKKRDIPVKHKSKKFKIFEKIIFKKKLFIFRKKILAH